MKKYFLFFLALFTLVLLLASYAGAYSDAEHTKNLQYSKYKKNYVKMEAALKEAEKSLHPTLFKVMQEEQNDWFKGFINQDYDGADGNIDAKAGYFMEFEEYSERDAYAAAVGERVAAIKELTRRCWLMMNPKERQGIYFKTGNNESGDECESILEIIEGKNADIELRLFLLRVADEGEMTREFWGTGTLKGGRFSLVDVKAAENEIKNPKPLYVSFDGDSAIVTADDSFRNDEEFSSWYEGFLIDGNYLRKIFAP